MGDQLSDPFIRSCLVTSTLYRLVIFKSENFLVNHLSLDVVGARAGFITNMLGYLSLDLICSSKLTAHCEHRGTGDVREQIS